MSNYKSIHISDIQTMPFTYPIPLSCNSLQCLPIFQKRAVEYNEEEFML